MQFDKTQLAVRERGVLETYDLSLHVLTRYFSPLARCWLLGVVPFALINYLTLGWLADYYYHEGSPVAYLFAMPLVIYLQSQAACVFMTTYLGKAVFTEKPTWSEVFEDAGKMGSHVAYCQLLLRAALPGMALAALLPWVDSDFWGLIWVGLVLCVLIAVGVRSFRPYINEIILLEQNPLFGNNDQEMTLGKRSQNFHSIDTGDMVLHWLAGSLYSAVLGPAFVLGFYAAVQLFKGKWGEWGWFELNVVVPLGLWTFVGLMGIINFLAYLNLRIRGEGWEVQLKLQSEVNRMLGLGGKLG